jgi:hypothetical protein
VDVVHEIVMGMPFIAGDVAIVNVGTVGYACTTIESEFDGSELPVAFDATTAK